MIVPISGSSRCAPISNYSGVHWLVDIRELRADLWRARASDAKASVQARNAGMTALGVDWVVVDKPQTHCPRLERLVPWV
jgi:hypothetical protein